MNDRFKQASRLIAESYSQVGGINTSDQQALPTQECIDQILTRFKLILYPGFFEPLHIEKNQIEGWIQDQLSDLSDRLRSELIKVLPLSTDRDPLDPDQLVADSVAYIPTLRGILAHDIEAIFLGDPAAGHDHEIILSYPGFFAVMVYRIAHFLYQKGIHLVPRMMTEYAHRQTGIDIHPGAQIGTHFCIDHGTGVVIGETAIIGHHVKLYQGVTIGALSVSKSDVKTKRHPTIGNHVTIYARTTILGGETHIGDHSIIGGNVWLISSVAEKTRIYVHADKKQQIIESMDDDSTLKT